ncbi:sex comb on midleg-like protein 1 [Choloepus didactylus]|uniref:sex comb on midleg-like protein 1 n=1 Tax=Choloepus didactylus TaxID=27675 RepID=UPI0018A01CBA|nr:sex comb on midleg-like protein 1 [Choloepus didactylus]
MPSGSSDHDVKKTRMPACGNDNTVLYAYKPNNTCVRNQESVPSDTSHNKEQQKTVLNVLTHCRAIYDGIQNLEKKFDVIHEKVPKIYRFRMRSSWQHRKPLGYVYKNYNYLLYRKIKFQRMRKKEPLSASFYPESYSATLPVERQKNDDQSKPMETSFQSEEPFKPEQPIFGEQKSVLGKGPLLPSRFTHSFQPYFSSEVPMPDASTMRCFASQGAPRTSSVFSSAQACTAATSAMMVQGEPSSRNNPDLMDYDLPENKDISQNTNSSSICVPSSFVTSSPIGLDSRLLTQSFLKYPSSWSVDEVIQFMKRIDSQTFTPLADLFRYHNVDGKALLLLKSDTMMKYMGLKLGTAVKLCHHIKSLKKEKYFSG